VSQWNNAVDDPPEPGTVVLAWDGTDREVCFYFINALRKGRYSYCDGEYGFLPSHWMPLPDPPEEI